MLFKDGEIGVYHNKEELFDLIKSGLQNDKSECVNRERKSVLADHSFDSRIKQVLELLELES
jgi:spore maturation protein CgeB